MNQVNHEVLAPVLSLTSPEDLSLSLRTLAKYHMDHSFFMMDLNANDSDKALEHVRAKEILCRMARLTCAAQGSGTPTGRLLSLLDELDKRFPDPEPFSAICYETRFLAWLDEKLKDAKSTEQIQG